MLLVILSPLGVAFWVIGIATFAIIALMFLGASRRLETVRADRRRARVQKELGPLFSRFLETDDSVGLADALRPEILRMNAAYRPVAATFAIELMHAASSPEQKAALRHALEEAGIVELGHRGTHRRSPWRRALACEALGTIGSDSSVPVLVARFEDRRPEVRMAAVRALGDIGSEEAVPALGDAYLEGRVAPTDIINDSLRKIGGEAGTIFERGLAVKNPNIRGSSCFGLAALAHQRTGCVWRLAEVLALDSDLRVRTAAAAALGIAGGDEVPDPLLAAANDPVVAVRRAAVRALGSFDDPRSGPTLDACTDNEDRETAIRAAESLFTLARRPRAAARADALLQASPAWAVEYARTVEQVTGQVTSA
ncbi:MAG: HEAT repeat domain-containing protein [Conexibacteraceae bacterium]|nr:HEAT repeat domain-containing protein [Conexibacteraceae bacterium]